VTPRFGVITWVPRGASWPTGANPARRAQAVADEAAAFLVPAWDDALGVSGRPARADVSRCGGTAGRRLVDVARGRTTCSWWGPDRWPAGAAGQRSVARRELTHRPRASPSAGRAGRSGPLGRPDGVDHRAPRPPAAPVSRSVRASTTRLQSEDEGHAEPAGDVGGKPSRRNTPAPASVQLANTSAVTARNASFVLGHSEDDHGDRARRPRTPFHQQLARRRTHPHCVDRVSARPTHPSPGLEHLPGLRITRRPAPACRRGRSGRSSERRGGLGGDLLEPGAHVPCRRNSSASSPHPRLRVAIPTLGNCLPAAGPASSVANSRTIYQVTPPPSSSPADASEE